MKKVKMKIAILLTAFFAFIAFCVGMAIEYRKDKNTSVVLAAAETAESNENGAEIDETLTPEETPEAEKSVDIEAFLAGLQKYADEAGVGDEYAKAVQAIKTAASTKQVTIATIASVAMLAVLIVYMISKHMKDVRLNKKLVELSKETEALRKGVNALIDETNANGRTAAKTEKEGREIEAALSSMSKMFTLFADRVRIGDATKEEIKRENLNVQKAVNGEVTANEKKE
jgi:hypothetical protein